MWAAGTAGRSDPSLISRGRRMSEKQEIIAEHRLHETDTGSSEVQIALLTERISHLT